MQYCAPSKEQMKTYRQTIERECKVVQRAIAAEEKAATVDRIYIDSISSQVTVDSMIAENSKATPIESSTGVKSRIRKATQRFAFPSRI